jgi:hypothetical protein
MLVELAPAPCSAAPNPTAEYRERLALMARAEGKWRLK